MSVIEKITTDIIRKAIIKNRGGHENATDEQIGAVWDSLDAETKTQYLKSIKGGSADVSTGKQTGKNV